MASPITNPVRGQDRMASRAVACEAEDTKAWRKSSTWLTGRSVMQTFPSRPVKGRARTKDALAAEGHRLKMRPPDLLKGEDSHHSLPQDERWLALGVRSSRRRVRKVRLKSAPALRLEPLAEVSRRIPRPTTCAPSQASRRHQRRSQGLPRPPGRQGHPAAVIEVAYDWAPQPSTRMDVPAVPAVCVEAVKPAARDV